MSLLVCAVKKSDASLICCVFCPHQTMCVVSRMSAFVVSLKTGVMSSTGRGRITWRRIPSDLPIPARKPTAVEPRRVRKQGLHFCDYQSWRCIDRNLSENENKTEMDKSNLCSRLWVIECRLVAFRLLHVHRSVAAACARGQGSSAFSTLQCDFSQRPQGLRQSPILCLLLLPHEGQTHRWVARRRMMLINIQRRLLQH